jgi:hypothetical protein
MRASDIDTLFLQVESNGTWAVECATLLLGFSDESGFS